MDLILETLTLVDDSLLEKQIQEIVHSTNPAIVGFLNQHGYNLASKNGSIKNFFLNMDYMFRDGKGIALACNYHKIEPKLNLNGTDFIPKLIDGFIESSNDLAFFAYGTKEPWLTIGAENLFKTKKFYSLDGFKSDDTYIKHFFDNQNNNVNIVVLAMGMPKQERIATLIKGQAKGKVIIICGGAILDFQAGRVQRAPKVFRTIGMEWLYRLACEPVRLFGRYVIGIPVFFWNVYKTNRGI